MSSRGILTLALMIAAVACERLTYYGARTLLVVDLSSAGDDIASSAATYATMSWVSLASNFVGAAIAFVAGPRVAGAIGTLIAAAGCFILAAGSLAAGGIVVAAGAGILRPCPPAAAAEVLGSEDGAAAPSPRRFAAVTAFVVLMYGALNVAASIAPILSSALRHEGEASSVAYGVHGSLALLATVFMGTAAALGFVRPNAPAALPPTDVYRTPAFGPNAPTPAAGNALVGLAILAAANVFYTAGFPLTYPSFRDSFPTWMYSVNPIVVALATAVLGLVWIVATQQRWSIAPLTFYGIGIAVFGFGLLVIGISGEALGGHLLGQMIAAVGESAAGPIGIAYAALAIRNRAATLIVAGWTAVGMVVSLFSVALGTTDSRVGFAIVFAFVLGGGGVALAALGRKIHRELFDPPITA